MDIAALKEQARALEHAGEAAAALTIYDELLEELDRTGAVPDGALFVKIGDLSLKTGQRSRAVTLFERAAEQYASVGADKSVLALCLKILRTNPRRADVHLRFAKQLFVHGYTDATRRVLLDYAERTQLEKTRATLERLEGRAESDVKAKLDEFFRMADRAARRSGEHRAINTPMPKPVASETAQHLAVIAEALAKEPPAPKAPPLDPIMAEISAKKPAVEPPPVEPVPVAPATPQLTVVSGGQAAAAPASAQGDRRTRRRRPVWAWPIAAAAAVLVLGVGLMGFGAIPFGGDLDAKQPEADAAAPLATASILGAATVDSSVTPSEVNDGAAVADPVAEATPAGASLRVAPEARPPAPEEAAPTNLDRVALTAATQAIAAVDVEVVDVPVDPSILAPDQIAIPTAAASTPNAIGSDARPSRPVEPQSVVAIDGLEITGVVRTSESYRLVQRLASGGTVALIVTAFDNAPAGESGQLNVQKTPGDSATGSRRFRDFWVTASAQVNPAVLERLLDKLTERSWQ